MRLGTLTDEELARYARADFEDFLGAGSVELELLTRFEATLTETNVRLRAAAEDYTEAELAEVLEIIRDSDLDPAQLFDLIHAHA